MTRVFVCVLLFASVGQLSAPAMAEDSYVFAHYSVTTQNPSAQQAFDRGLTFIYAFNRQAAESAFRKAADLDPSLAMAWWGVALSLGPNINIVMSQSDLRSARDAIGKAKALESHASPEERELIDALDVRYQNDNQDRAAIPYAAAMEKVAKDYPNDPDVEALYLESRMDDLFFNSATAKWTQWSHVRFRAGADVTRWPEHIGVLHYFIHITEPDTSALAFHAADTLAADKFAPQASHLTHMPSHVYVHAGEWSKVEQLNREAVRMDLTQAKEAGKEPSTLDYFFHNLSFWYGSAIMAGDATGALAAAAAWLPYNKDAQWVTESRLGQTSAAVHDMEASGISGRLTGARLPILVAYGVTSAESGKLSDAQRVADQIHGKKNLGRVGTVAYDMVAGRIAEANGQRDDAEALYSAAAQLQDQEDFEDAPPWNYYPRELLADLQLRSGDPVAAKESATADLLQHPKSSPAMQLLARANTALRRLSDAGRVRLELLSLYPYWSADRLRSHEQQVALLI